MLKLYIYLVLFFGVNILMAQTIYPVDQDTKLITYTEVVQEEGTVAELYKNAHQWAFSFYKNPYNVVKEDTPNKLLMRPRFKIMNPSDKKGVKTMAGIVIYTLEIYLKEGRYKYKLTQIQWKKASKYPIERWLDKSAPTYLKKYEFYLKQVDAEAKRVITSLKEGIKQKKKKEEENW